MINAGATRLGISATAAVLAGLDEEPGSAPAADTSAAAPAPAKKDHSKPKHTLKHHGSAKGKAKAAAASAAGTNDAGAAN